MASGVAIALVSAAIGDPLVERLADAGLFGAGYADGDQAGAAPALVAGLAIAFVLALRFCARSLTDPARARRTADALSSCARPVAFVAIFALQLAFVYAIEVAESLAAGAALPHGLSWLGAPVAVALAIEGAIGLICATLARSAARALLASAVLACRDALERALVRRDRRLSAALASRVASDAPAVLAVVVLCRRRGRAPPSLAFA